MIAIAGVCRDWAMVIAGVRRRRLDRDRRRPRRSGPASASIAGPLRADAESLQVDLGPGLSRAVHAIAASGRAARSARSGPAQTVPWLGQYWAPWLLGARVQGHFGDRSLDGASAYAEKNWGAAFADHWWWGQAAFAEDAGVAFAGGRVHGVAPTAIAVWTPRRADHPRTAAGAHAHPRRRRRVARPRALTALARRARPARRATRSCCRSRSRASGGSRSARATTCSGARSCACGAAGACGSRGRLAGGARGRRYTAWLMTSSAMSSSPPSTRPSTRRTWAQTASGGSRTLDQRAPQPLEPVVDRRARAPRSGRRCRTRASLPAGSRRRGARTRTRPRRAAAPGAASTNAGGASSGAISGGRCPASENVSCRRSRVVDRGQHGRHRQVQQRRGADAQVREHAVGRVAVVGVGGQHRAQLAHPRGGLGAVAHHVADHEQQPAVLERVRDVEVAADVAPAGAREVAGGELDAGQRAASSLGSSERWSVSASRRSTS